MLRKCGLYLLSFAVLSTSLSVFFSDVSSAVGQYDAKYVQTNSVGIQTSGCEFQDFTNNYLDPLINDSNNTAPITSYLNAQNGNGRWGVSSWSNGYTIFWTEDDSLYFDWTSDSSYLLAKGNNLHTIDIVNDKFYHGGNSCDPVGSWYATNGPYAYVSSVDQSIKSLFVYSDYKNYPPDYDGPEIPDSPNGGKSTVYPDIDYTVQDKLVSVKYKDTLPFKPCSMNYLFASSDRRSVDFGDTWIETLSNGWGEIFKGDLTLDAWRNDAGKDFDVTKTEFMYKKSTSSEVTYTANDYGSVVLMVGGNTHWEGAPRLDCGDSGDESDFSYEIVPRVININIDGSSYAGTSSGADCSLDGRWCTTDDTVDAALYENCDAIDILCHMRNAYKMFIQLFTYLAVPRVGDIKPYFDSFVETADNQMGFLADSFQMLFSALQLIIATGDPAVGYKCGISLPMYGAPATVELCAWKYQFPALWELVQRSIQAGIALTLVYIFYRKLNKMTGRDVEDGTDIEANPYPGQSVSWVDERTGERGKIK